MRNCYMKVVVVVFWTTYNWLHSVSFLAGCWQLFSAFAFIAWFIIVIDFVTDVGRVSDDGWMARYVVVTRWSLPCIGSFDRYDVVVVDMHDVWPIFEIFGFDCVIYFPVAVVFLPAITFCPITFGWTHMLFMDITVRCVVCCTNLVFAFMVLLLLLLLFLWERKKQSKRNLWSDLNWNSATIYNFNWIICVSVYRYRHIRLPAVSGHITMDIG